MDLHTQLQFLRNFLTAFFVQNLLLMDFWESSSSHSSFVFFLNILSSHQKGLSMTVFSHTACAVKLYFVLNACCQHTSFCHCDSAGEGEKLSLNGNKIISSPQVAYFVSLTCLHLNLFAFLPSSMSLLVLLE